MYTFTTTVKANPFKHKHINGEKYRIITEVKESIYINGKFLNNSYIYKYYPKNISKGYF